LKRLIIFKLIPVQATVVVGEATVRSDDPRIVILLIQEPQVEAEEAMVVVSRATAEVDTKEEEDTVVVGEEEDTGEDTNKVSKHLILVTVSDFFFQEEGMVVAVTEHSDMHLCLLLVLLSFLVASSLVSMGIRCLFISCHNMCVLVLICNTCRHHC